ncbi:unnamed protein product [Schistosoma mattheei]|nr:unnamed protein product [Schistosoma mattheei]
MLTITIIINILKCFVEIERLFFVNKCDLWLIA